MSAVRDLNTDDLEPCASLFCAVFSAAPWNDRWPSQKAARDYLQDIVRTPGFKGYVAYQDERLVGVCLGHVKRWWSGKEFFIDEMYVAPDMQRRGVGSELLKFAEADLRASDVRRLTLLTASNTEAESFYQRRGFEANRRLVFLLRNMA